MSKPVVARRPNGAEYGFVDAETARKQFPDAKIVRYQDGSAYEEPKPKAKPKAETKDAKK